MEENKVNIPQALAVGYPAPYGYDPREDEINLADLWYVLVKRRKVLLGVTAVVTIGAVLYALLATPVYRAEVVFLSPTAGDIQALNIEGVQEIDINSVYTIFERNLSSRPPRRAIYDKMNLLDQFEPDKDQDTNLDVIFDEYNQSFSITTPKIKKNETAIPTITFAMEWEDPVLTAEIINRIADEAERAAKAEILLDIQTRIGIRVIALNQEIERLHDMAIKQRLDEIEQLETADVLARKMIQDIIASLREKARSERIDRISTLKEAAEIARSLDIKDSIDYTQTPPVISINAPQLYTRGYEAIEAEITSLSNRKVDDAFIPDLRGLQENLKLLEHNRRVEQLKSRKNDDPFIASLRDKENELMRFESIHIDPETVKTARIDQAAFPPDERIKPKRKLIVVLGLMLGLMLGVFAAFFVNFLESQKEEVAEA